MKKKNIFILLIFLVPLIAVILSIFGVGRILELKTLDFRFSMRGEQKASDKVCVVFIGDESLSPEAFGRWPWRRALMATFLDIIRSYNPHSVIFDVLFTEPSGESIDGINDDGELAGQAALMGRVLFPFYGLYEPDKNPKIYKKQISEVKIKLLEKIILNNIREEDRKKLFRLNNIVLPIDEFSATANSSGYVNVVPDPDGVRRRMPLVMLYEDKVIPSMAFQAAMDYLGVSSADVIIEPGRNIILKREQGDISIPVDEHCQMLVNHTGKFYKADNINKVSFFELFQSAIMLEEGGEATFDMEKLKDKVIFVGLTATATSDQRATPFSSIFPMVGFQLTITSNIIEANYLRPVKDWINYLIIIAAGLIAAFITFSFHAFPSALLNILFAVVFYWISFRLFRNNMVIETFYPVLSIILSYLFVTIYKFTSEEQEKKMIRGMFQRYVSSTVVDTLLDHPEQIKLGGDRKRLTVFFSDIRGFTSMSEKMEPEEVVSILNEYLTEMIEIIFEYNGTLDKFIGDAVMAVWGAPVALENHAELAVRAAWAMREKVLELRKKWEKEGRRKIGVGMGVNTGDMVVGNMGSNHFADYTVIGDNVNLAARLEENAMAGQLIISETTYEEVRDIVEVKQLEPLRVKGKEKPVEVYEVVGLRTKNENPEGRG